MPKITIIIHQLVNDGFFLAALMAHSGMLDGVCIQTYSRATQVLGLQGFDTRIPIPKVPA